MTKVAIPREIVVRHPQKTDYGQFNNKPAVAYLGLVQNRRIYNLTFSRKLIAYRACVASKLKNSKPGNFGNVLTNFKKAAEECKAAVANIESGGKRRYSGTDFFRQFLG
ncbi:MAG: hypothetical protein QW061_03170 [Candidatus Rehaiarchaeum fermentans]|nr:hypothetical protein [Candidatus Rehaiarchaeum fermentans]